MDDLQFNLDDTSVPQEETVQGIWMTNADKFVVGYIGDRFIFDPQIWNIYLLSP